MPGPPTYVVDMHHSKRRRIGLCCLVSKRCRCRCVVWGWSLYNIVESESDPLTFSKKNPSRAIPRSTYIHPPSLAKISQRTSEEIGNRIKIWLIVSMPSLPKISERHTKGQNVNALFGNRNDDWFLIVAMIHSQCYLFVEWAVHSLPCVV